MALQLLLYVARKEGPMETIVEIIYHTNQLKPVAQLEIFTYVTLIFLTVSLGIASVWLRRG
jgi:hypothetical protein